jgi:hypothetical protein
MIGVVRVFEPASPQVLSTDSGGVATFAVVPVSGAGRFVCEGDNLQFAGPRHVLDSPPIMSIPSSLRSPDTDAISGIAVSLWLLQNSEHVISTHRYKQHTCQHLRCIEMPTPHLTHLSPVHPRSAHAPLVPGRQCPQFLQLPVDWSFSTGVTCSLQSSLPSPLQSHVYSWRAFLSHTGILPSSWTSWCVHRNQNQNQKA